MGAWGVKAHECDTSLDMLAIVESKILQPIDYRHFNVRSALDLLKDHVIEEIRNANRGCDVERIAYYIDYNFSADYGYAIRLVSECLADYVQNGEYIITDYETDTEIKISEFVYTDSDLDELLKELQEMIDPSYYMHSSWFEDEVRQAWKAHMEMIYGCIASLKGGICHE
jgi:hypothetical protein